MDNYTDYKQELLTINKILIGLLEKGSSVPGAITDVLEDWSNSCRQLQRQLSEDTLRIAVVGTIKSGKSTFLNSWLGGDFLKRGAGVVTSIVTRIHHGAHPVSRLVFKSWTEVNQDVIQALVLMPAAHSLDGKTHFDIRDTGSREALKALIGNLSVEDQISNGSRNLNAVMLANYIDGYERIKDILAEENVVKKFKNNGFVDHWRYVGDDSLAVYLKDLQLELNSRHLDPATELADCQGSDSPNPLHLAMIQDYLQQVHLIVYIVSSRTGLREADIKFLSIIRRMGLGESVLLVVNADISEHESLSDFRRLVAKVNNELKLVLPEPQCFALSALYQLFDSDRKHLSETDRMRLAQWENQAELTGFLITEFQRFQQDFQRRMVRKRYQLMLKSQLERHSVVLAGLSHWIRVNRELLSRRGGNTRKLFDGLKAQQERMLQIKTGIESTTAGVLPRIKRELNLDVDRFFDTHSGPCLRQLLDFLRFYQVNPDKYSRHLDKEGFLKTVYTVFQEFKQAFDLTMTQSVYPEIVSFVRSEEEKISQHLEAILEPYGGIVEQGFADMGKALNGLMTEGPVENHPIGIELPDIDAVRASAGLRLPPLVPFLMYTKRVKTEAFVHAGYFSVLKVVKKIFRFETSVTPGSYNKALQRSVRLMKKQMEESLLFQAKNYRENLKFAYFHRLVEEVTQRFAESLAERFRIFVDTSVSMVDHVSQLQTDKDHAIDKVREMEILAVSTGDRINRLRRKIEHV